MARMRRSCLYLWILLFTLPLNGADLRLKIVDASGDEYHLPELTGVLSGARAVFIGENHDRYDNHLSEVEVIRRLHEHSPGHWAVGVEFIQRRFQPQLDAYLAGSIDEREFLIGTEYFDRWGFDYRLYRPIFRYAKENGIPMVALNAERELTERVGEAGLDGLSDAERQRLPSQIDKSDAAYRDRVHEVFQEHPGAEEAEFEHFWEAQLVWDETMAEQAANYLQSHPGKAVVVLAGAQHIAFGSGVPSRVVRRVPELATAVLLTEKRSSKLPSPADYFLESKRIKLPPAGKMGITMDGSSGVTVKAVAPGSAAAKAGVQPKDRIVAVDDQPVKAIGDVRYALIDKTAGQQVTLHIQRELQNLRVVLKLRK